MKEERSNIEDHLLAVNKNRQRAVLEFGGASLRRLTAVLGCVLGIVILACPPAPAKPRFTSSEIEGKASDFLFCDLDGDHLKDLVLIDEPNLVVFQQDARGSFARKPYQIYNLGDEPSAVWAEKMGKEAESLLVMTSKGVTELSFSSRTKHPERRQIITQQTVIPETLDKPSVMHFPLSAQTTSGWPVMLLPVGDDLQVWQHRQKWYHAHSLERVLETLIWPSVRNPGYSKTIQLDMSFGDINGDHRDDLIICSSGIGTQTYAVYPQNHDGLLAAEPSLTFEDKWDWRSWLCWADIDRDGRVDLIKSTWLFEPWFLPGTRSGKVLVRIYFADEQGRIPPEPQCVFRKNDWMSAIPIVDVDGDGFLDLVLGYSPFDSREGLRKTITAKQLDFNLKFHFYRPGTGFLPKPDYQRDLLIHLDYHSMHLTWSRRRYFERFVNLTGDFDGDGDKDLLVRDRNEKISVYFFLSREVGFSKMANVGFSYTKPIEWLDVRDLNNDHISDLVMKLRKREVLRIFVSNTK